MLLRSVCRRSACFGLAGRAGALSSSLQLRNFRTTAALNKVLAGKLLTVDRHVYRLNNPPELVVFDKVSLSSCPRFLEHFKLQVGFENFDFQN